MVPAAVRSGDLDRNIPLKLRERADGITGDSAAASLASHLLGGGITKSTMVCD
jgi:hypothetical protein